MKYGGGMNELPYPSDLTAAQWALIERLLPAPKPKGRKRRVDLRKITNAILYVLKGGISWRMLPREFAPWKTVYHYFRLWRLGGLWDRIHDQLRDQVRVSKGRHICPSAAIETSIGVYRYSRRTMLIYTNCMIWVRRSYKLSAIEAGAVRAAREAKDQKIIHAFGITGHSHRGTLIECMKRFDPDTVLTTFLATESGKGTYDQLLALARSRQMGVLKRVPDQAETILFGVEGHLPSPPHIIACGPGTQAAKSLN